jgi:tripeptide aminopeptidase
VSEFDFSRLKSKQAYVFDLSGEVGASAYCAPTILSFKLELFGKASHAGFAPQDGVHSIKAVASIVSQITCGKIDEDTTVNIGTISGGSADNIVPDYCAVTGEIRSYSDDKAVEQFNTIESISKRVADEFNAKLNITFERNVTAYETPLDHLAVKRFENSCEALSIKPSLVRSFGGSDNNVFALNGITGLVVATAMNNCHSTSEWTTVDELKKSSQIALELMMSKE